MAGEKTLKAVRAKIRELERKAKRLEQANKPGIDDVVKLIRKHKLTPADLRTAMTQSKKKKTATRKSGKKASVKYRDSKGNTWAGRGRAPNWLVEAEKAGRSRDGFLVKRKKRSSRTKKSARPK